MADGACRVPRRRLPLPPLSTCGRWPRWRRQPKSTTPCWPSPGPGWPSWACGCVTTWSTRAPSTPRASSTARACGRAASTGLPVPAAGVVAHALRQVFGRESPLHPLAEVGQYTWRPHEVEARADGLKVPTLADAGAVAPEAPPRVIARSAPLADVLPAAGGRPWPVATSAVTSQRRGAGGRHDDGPGRARPARGRRIRRVQAQTSRRSRALPLRRGHLAAGRSGCERRRGRGGRAR